MQFVITIDNAITNENMQRLGGKGKALASLIKAGFSVPACIAVVPEAFDGNTVNGEAAKQIAASVASLRSGFFAIRSSAADEDGTAHSFAGQLESFLCVKPEDVLQRVIDVFNSAFAERVIAYRQEHCLSGESPIPTVLIQEMVHADSSGVAFSADPTANTDRSVIGAVYGLGEGLVSGQLDADTYFVSGELIERDIARKTTAYHLATTESGGIELRAVDELSARKSALTDEQIKAVSQLAIACEAHFKTPQDIEWAYAERQLYLLQSRPITTAISRPAAKEELRIFDNSNIGESYNGVTTPLTFSFARRAYENVYLQFCRILQVNERTLQREKQVFANMIGLIRGRIYYNLISWYRVLALLPGYALNAPFMEQMMGVKEPLPQEVKLAQKKPRRLERWLDCIALAWSLLGLIASFVTLKSRIAKFYVRLNDALKPVELKNMSIDQLLGYYHLLEAKLLLQWDAPLVNDFFAMIFYGVLKSLTQLVLWDAQSNLHNDLLAQTGDIISAEPAARIAKMARVASADPSLVDVLCNKSLSVIERRLKQEPEFKTMIDAYLEKFGDRCIGELKLESPTLLDDPLPLLRSVGQMASRIASGTRANRRQGRLIRRRAEQRVFGGGRMTPWEKAGYAWVLHNARETVRNRENLRFERTRVFGRVRQIFVEVGKRLQQQNLIDDYRDIFYLELSEIIGFVNGTATTLSLRSLVAVRKSEFDQYRAEDEPPTRIEIRGAAGIPAATATRLGNESKSTSAELQGIACCPGVVRGTVRVVHDPKDAVILSGEILVAKRTDPGWITLFPAASGLLVEHGSLLSHSAIVSRELGLPSIVSVSGICDELSTGDIVEFDGSSGNIRVIARHDAGTASVG
ncbi:MAG: PEP/pyruvate-binding domain-containing protein [Candidatus Obscuribacterales bacterium]